MAFSLHASPIELFIPDEGESADAFVRRLSALDGKSGLVLLGPREQDILTTHASEILSALQKTKAYVATKNPKLIRDARQKGIRVIERTDDLRDVLLGHPRLQEALRVFSPHLWKQQLKTQLQRMGLLSVPRLRIYSLVGLSALLFGFVLFRLLPSADIIVRARQETVTQTLNVFLVSSGAQLPSSRVRTLPLDIFAVTDHRALTFDQVSKLFVGTSAVVDVKIASKAPDSFLLKKGTRFQNQAGMVFRSLAPVTIPPGESKTIRIKADSVDAFDQIIGERGNIPAGLTWEIPGLEKADQSLLTTTNPRAASGGTTAYKTVLTQQDLEIARKRLEQELLANAKRLVDEEVELRNAQDPTRILRLIKPGEVTPLVRSRFGDFTAKTYSGFVLPTSFIGTEVKSVPLDGTIEYRAYGFDARAILDVLEQELQQHVREGKYLLESENASDRLVVTVIDAAPNLSWIKLTVDLGGTEEYILDPLTPDGALFGKRVRDQVAGLSVEDALRIVRNMPEVETATLSMWPPWSSRLPAIPAHISIVPE